MPKSNGKNYTQNLQDTKQHKHYNHIVQENYNKSESYVMMQYSVLAPPTCLYDEQGVEGPLVHSTSSPCNC